MTADIRTPTMTTVACANAPKPLGHYSQGILHGDTLYISGQLGVTKDTPEPDKVSIADQILFALTNIEAIAACVGGTREDIVKATLYVTDIEHWGEANEAYASFFGEHRPARSVVPTRELHLQAKVEIEAVVAIQS